MAEVITDPIRMAVAAWKIAVKEDKYLATYWEGWLYKDGSRQKLQEMWTEFRRDYSYYGLNDFISSLSNMVIDGVPFSMDSIEVYGLKRKHRAVELKDGDDINYRLYRYGFAATEDWEITEAMESFDFDD